MQKYTKNNIVDAFTRNEFRVFVERAFYELNPGQEFKPNWHIDYICEALMLSSQGKLRKLLINIPPRTLKSFIVNVCFPAWIMGREPYRKFISTSYASNLSNEHSRACVDLMRTDWYRSIFPECKITSAKSAPNAEIITDYRGVRFSTSATGTVTGKGGDYIIVDDIHNPMQANSDTQRQTGLNHYTGTLSNRGNDPAAVRWIVIMQRLHEEDLTGFILDNEKDWYHINLPAVNTGETRNIKLGRFKYTWKTGELLHPERLTEQVLKDFQTTMGSYNYAGQYLQEPAPLEGGLVKRAWFLEYKDKSAFEEIIISLDTAMKEKETNDPSVATVWGVKNNHYYLIDVYRERVEYPKLKKAILRLAEQYKPNAILIEDKASGISLIQDLKRSTQLPIIAVNPKGDKVVRLSACTALIEAGRVFIPERAHFIADYVKELCIFPNGKHDDQVDSTSQFLNWVKTRNQFNFRIATL